MKAKKLGKPKSTGKTTVIKVPQPHGGALNAGGTPGNRGGRPSGIIRRGFANVLDDHGLDFVTGVLTGKEKEATVSDKLKAVDQAAKIGLGEKHEVVAEDVRDKLQQQVAIIGSKPVWDSQELLDQLSEVWK